MQLTVVIHLGEQDIATRAWPFCFSREGLALLDDVRSIKGSGVLLGNIKIEEWKDRQIEIAISEEKARKSGHFAHKNWVSVSISRKVRDELEKLSRIEVVDGEIEELTSKYSVCILPDKKAIYALWESAGFPLEWK